VVGFMEEIYEITLLLDFYGQLLTEKEYVMLDLHYNNDFSLSEIAENMNISRQGVYDNIRRGKKNLAELENKLGLVRKFSEQKKAMKDILQELKEFDCSKLESKDRARLKNIYENLELLIEKL